MHTSIRALSSPITAITIPTFGRALQKRTGDDRSPRIAVAVATLAALLFAPLEGRADQKAADKVADALIALQAHRDVAQRRMGEDGAADLGARLADDAQNFDDTTPPAGFPQNEWDERLSNVADLDSSLVAQVLSGKREPLASARGLVERILVSTVDGTLQPVALYVPDQPGPSPSLVVLLHGRPQTESDILAGPYFRRLADATGAIIVAPYGRGNYDFFGPATDDVYQAADEIAAAYHIDAHRVFLVGYSMGGFSVFKVGPVHASRWAAVMCISGAILNSEADSVTSQFRKTPMYVVTGANDQSIPTKYAELTAQYLAGAGLATGFYRESSGTHMIPTLMPALTTAWNDMLHGIVRNAPSSALSSLPPMAAPPIMPLKP